jgi:hypothetical protein
MWLVHPFPALCSQQPATSKQMKQKPKTYTCLVLSYTRLVLGATRWEGGCAAGSLPPPPLPQTWTCCAVQIATRVPLSLYLGPRLAVSVGRLPLPALPPLGPRPQRLPLPILSYFYHTSDTCLVLSYTRLVLGERSEQLPAGEGGCAAGSLPPFPFHRPK